MISGTTVMCGELMRAGIHRCYLLLPHGGEYVRVGIVPHGHKIGDLDEDCEPFQGGYGWDAAGKVSFHKENGELGWGPFSHEPENIRFNEEQRPTIGLELDLDRGILWAFKNGERVRAVAKNLTGFASASLEGAFGSNKGTDPAAEAARPGSQAFQCEHG